MQLIFDWLSFMIGLLFGFGLGSYLQKLFEDLKKADKEKKENGEHSD